MDVDEEGVDDAPYFLVYCVFELPHKVVRVFEELFDEFVIEAEHVRVVYHDEVLLLLGGC